MSSETPQRKAASSIGRRGFLGGALVTGAAIALPTPAFGASAESAAGSAAPASDIPPDARSLVPITPQRIALAISKVDEIVKSVRRRTGVPGIAVAVIHQGKVRYAEGFGTRNLRTGLPVTTDTVFQLASVSKPLTSTVVAGIVGDKHNGVSWTDPIVKYLPNFALRDPYVTANVTIADMLTHRSGLPGAAGDLLEDLGYDQAYVLDRLRLDPLSPFRTQHAYTNFGFTSGGVAATNAIGKEFADAADDILFKPVGMSTASFRHADFVARSNRTAMHVRRGSTWVQAYSRNADPEAPAGGASASVNDLARWLILQLNLGSWNGTQIIDSDALFETRLPYSLSSFPSTPNSRTGFYGLGTDVGYDATGRLRVSHSGAFAQGAATNFGLLPAEDLGIVVLTNGMPIGAAEAISAYFYDYVEAGSIQFDWLAGYGALFARLFVNHSVLAGKKPPAHPRPAHALPYYTGTYKNDFYGPIDIVSRGGSLHLLIGPEPKDYPLSHWDGELFSFEPSGENALGITAATFLPGRTSSKAGKVTLEFYDAEGLGTFSR